MAHKRLAVFGGNGFLGTRICQAAVGRNWQVISLGRSGEPDWKATGQGTRPDWAAKVRWVSADIFEPATYKEHLSSVSAVVHSMGLLLEADYKDVLRGNENPVTGLRKAFRSQQRDEGPANPLERTPENSQHNASSTSNLTYEKMNRDSAIIAARAFLENSKEPNKAFLFVSAVAGFPILPPRYILTKREAEVALSQMPELRSLFLRPGMLISAQRPITVPLGYLIALSSSFNKVTGQLFASLLGAAGYPATNVDVAGKAVVQAFEDLSRKGSIEPRDIEELGSRM